MDKITEEKNKEKINSIHTVTTTTTHVKVCKSNMFRYISIDKLFDCIELDDIKHYEFKDLDINGNWFNNSVLTKMYKYNSLFMGFYFKTQGLPKRCEKFSNQLLLELSDFIKEEKGRVYKSKLKTTLRHFIKHTSRLHYHKMYSLIYPKRKDNWSKDKRLSYEYMKDIINYLEIKGELKEYSGYQSYDKNVTSMIILKPTFIHKCNGGVVDRTGIDECLKVGKEKPLVTITEPTKTGKTKIKRRLTKEEKIVASNIEEVLNAYNDFLSSKMIEVNGVLVPELFFTRVFSSNLNSGGRFYDDGSIQQESKPIRDTTLIDGEQTVELDYHGLHYSMAAELLGVDLKGKDPYDFEYHVDLDKQAVKLWEEEYGMKLHYDPLRNLKKITLLVLFNADSKSAAVKAISKAIIDDFRKEDKLKRRLVGISKVKIKELVDTTIKHNEIVSEYFLKGVWAEFQNKDSRLMNYCVKTFLNSNEVCLPIHDSLIVKESLKGFAIKTMEDAYEEVMGSKLNCKVS